MARKRRRFRRNPKRHHRVHHRRFRRNPIGGSDFLSNTLAPAAIGAAGAVATDYLSNMLPLPASLQTAAMAPITKIGVAILVGLGVGAVAGNKAGGEAAAGGIIVAMYNYATQNLVGGFGAGPGYGPMGRYVGFVRRNLGNGNPMNVNFGRPVGIPRLGPVGPGNFGPNLSGGPSNVTKFRILRGAGGRNQLGYIGPARTMSRYVAR